MENARDELEFDREKVESNEALMQAGKSLDLTPKERQQGHCSKIVQFTYYHQLLKAYMEHSAAGEIEALSMLIERDRAGLRALLTEG